MEFESFIKLEDNEMAKDYSFDVVCRTDLAEAANAVNQAEKEIRTRYDFKGSKSSVTLSEGTLTLLGDDEFKLRLVREIVNGKLVKRGISLKISRKGKGGGCRRHGAPGADLQERHRSGAGQGHREADQRVRHQGAGQN